LIALPDSVNHFLAAIYRQGDSPGIPIEKHVCLSDGSIVREFSTTALYQKQVPPDFFSYPTKFKEVDPNSLNMYLSSKDHGEVNDLLKSVILDAPMTHEPVKSLKGL
jgi:hypothetical protein